MGWKYLPVTCGQLEKLLENYVTRDELNTNIDLVASGVEEITDQLGEQMADNQADIDAVAAELQQESSNLNSAVSAIRDEITQLQAQGVDVSALKAAADQLGQAVSAAADLVPEPSNPPSQN